MAAVGCISYFSDLRASETATHDQLECTISPYHLAAWFCHKTRFSGLRLSGISFTRSSAIIAQKGPCVRLGDT